MNTAVNKRDYEDFLLFVCKNYKGVSRRSLDERFKLEKTRILVFRKPIQDQSFIGSSIIQFTKLNFIKRKEKGSDIIYSIPENEETVIKLTLHFYKKDRLSEFRQTAYFKEVCLHVLRNIIKQKFGDITKQIVHIGKIKRKIKFIGEDKFWSIESNEDKYEKERDSQDIAKYFADETVRDNAIDEFIEIATPGFIKLLVSNSDKTDHLKEFLKQRYNLSDSDMFTFLNMCFSVSDFLQLNIEKERSSKKSIKQPKQHKPQNPGLQRETDDMEAYGAMLVFLNDLEQSFVNGGLKREQEGGKWYDVEKK